MIQNTDGSYQPDYPKTMSEFQMNTPINSQYYYPYQYYWYYPNFLPNKCPSCGKCLHCGK